MVIAGVTGGIGSGKSTVCRMLASHGAVIFYADDVAKRMMRDDPQLRRQIVDQFGEGSYNPDGSLNRAYLAELIFHDEDARKRINAIVHPAVRSAFSLFGKQTKASGASLLVKEAALLIESGIDDLDVVIVVDAPVEVRIQRVMERDHATRAEVEARMAAQMDPLEMISHADFVIENSGDSETLNSDVANLVTRLVQSES
jgi:dephospho-CoA kinase